MSKDKPMLFEYKRGEGKFSTIVAISDAGSVTYHNTVYPSGVTSIVKEAFLAEAEEAIMRKLITMDEDGENFSPWAMGGYYGD